MDSGIAGVAYAPQIAVAAAHYQLDPKLLAAVAAQETGGPGADSGANVVGDGGHGHGLFQIDDRSHAFASTAAAMDPAQNADYAAGMLAGLLQRYGGNVHAALSAYNAGSPNATGTTTNWGNGVQVGYADSVMMHYQQLGGNPAALPGGAGTAGAATAARDAAMPEIGETLASTNQLRNFASPGAATMIGSFSEGSATTSLSSSLNSALGAQSAMPVSLPAPSVPQTSQPNQAQQAQQQAPLREDLGNGDDSDADPSQAVSAA